MVAHTGSRVKATKLRLIAYQGICRDSPFEFTPTAERVGISREDIATIVTLGAFIKGRAASHVERLGGMVEEEEREAVKILA